MLDATFKDMVSYEILEKETQPIWLLTAFWYFCVKVIWGNHFEAIGKIFIKLQRPSIVVSYNKI